MKDEIKEILEFDFQSQGERIEINEYERNILKDYITNLQEKSNNQAEEINRLVKQREKFIKKYGYLKEENEKLQKRNKEIYDGFMATTEELCEYSTRNEKAIEHIKNESWYCCKDDDEVIDRIAILNLLKILTGDDK